MSHPVNERRGQNFSAIGLNFYEFPSEDPETLEAYCYTDRISYAPGDEIGFHLSTTGKTVDLEIYRDGADERVVYRLPGLAGELHRTPPDVSQKGCGWPVAHRWRIPADLPSGGYIVKTVAHGASDDEIEHFHFFAVRPAPGGPRGDFLLVCATSTWIAYNDWGGSNHYEGNAAGPGVNQMSPVLSTQRPWAAGQVWLPRGAPRIPLAQPPEPGAIPRYPNLEFAYATGLSKYYAAAGWASYERHFLHWAEQQGFTVDVATQHDLQFTPAVCDGYPCVVFVGHDEYWSAEQRDAVDAYVDSDGNVARFGGNFVWQVRLEDEGRRQVCYKYLAEEHDELARTQPEKLTNSWDHPQIQRPAAWTFGLTGSYSVYVGFGGFCPRHAGGFTVYRPEHWVFEGTDLYFGDTFGDSAGIFGFEVDGVDFTFRDGLPYPTFADGAPESLEILAMAPSTNLEEDHGNPGTRLYAGDGDLHFMSQVRFGDTSAEHLRKCRHGAGMIGVFTRNGGTVVNAGSVEWVNGLRLREPMTETVTRNVLNRFTRNEQDR